MYQAGEQVASASDATFPPAGSASAAATTAGTFDDLVVTAPARAGSATAPTAGLLRQGVGVGDVAVHGVSNEPVTWSTSSVERLLRRNVEARCHEG